MEYFLSARKFRQSSSGQFTLHTVYQTLADHVTRFEARGVNSQSLFLVHDKTDWIQRAIASGDKENVVFYIHGFRNGFKDCRQRTSALKRSFAKLGFNPTLVGFDWPSESQLSLHEFISRDQYDATRGRADVASRWLIKHGFAAFFAARPSLKIHVITHSMGATLLADGLGRIGSGAGEINMGGRKLGHIALVAPDEDRDKWTSGAGRAVDVVSQAKSVVNYYSVEDMVLDISGQRFGRHTKRSGRHGLRPSIPAGITDVACHQRYMKIKKFQNPETIESHNWYFKDPVFLKDVVGVFAPNLSGNWPSTRTPMGNGDDQLVAVEP